MITGRLSKHSAYVFVSAHSVTCRRSLVSGLDTHGLGGAVLEGNGRVVNEDVDAAVFLLHEIPEKVLSGT